MSIKSVSVAEAKRSFSELMAMVVYKGDEYIVERRGKPMVAIIKSEHLEIIHKEQERKGLIGIVGKFDDAQDFVEEVEKVYSLREKSKDREVIL